MDNRPIGVFDSGLGGLTGVKQLRKLLPGEEIVYFGDTGRTPYGGKSRSTLISYAHQDIDFLLEHNVKYIMAACGTVSSTFPKEEADMLPVPFIGVVDSAAAAAAAATRNKKVGVIGTQATIRSCSYENILRNLLPDVQIYKRACPMFVPLVENGYIHEGDKVTELIIEEYLTDMRNAGVDTLLLGCTHYPLLKRMIGSFMGDDVILIDPGKEAAAALKRSLIERNMLADRASGGAHFFVSDAPEGFREVANYFLGQYSEGPVERVSIKET